MGRVYRYRGKWYVDVWKDGKRIRRMVGTRKKLAEEILRKLEGDLVRDKFGIPGERKKIKFKEFSGLWLERYSRPNNAPSSYAKNEERLRLHLVPFFGDMSLDGIRPSHIDQYIAEKQGTISDSTINRTLALLKKILNDAIRWDLVSENPMKKVKMLREPLQRVTYLTESETRRFLQACSPEVYPVFCCAVYTGMRISEIISLKWGNVDLENGVVTLEGKGPNATKGRKTREISLHPHLLSVLRELHTGRTSGLVFAKGDGKARTGDVRGALRSALKKAGIEKKVRIHDLRHTFASNFVMHGGNILTLQRILGHSDLKLTMRYAHLAPDFMRQEVKRLDFA